MKFTKKMVEVIERQIGRKLTADEIERGAVKETVKTWCTVQSASSLHAHFKSVFAIYMRSNNTRTLIHLFESFTQKIFQTIILSEFFSRHSKARPAVAYVLPDFSSISYKRSICFTWLSCLWIPSITVWSSNLEIFTFHCLRRQDIQKIICYFLVN